jgi:hypothetical protein
MSDDTSMRGYGAGLREEKRKFRREMANTGLRNDLSKIRETGLQQRANTALSGKIQGANQQSLEFLKGRNQRAAISWTGDETRKTNEAKHLNDRNLQFLKGRQSLAVADRNNLGAMARQALTLGVGAGQAALERDFEQRKSIAEISADLLGGQELVKPNDRLTPSQALSRARGFYADPAADPTAPGPGLMAPPAAAAPAAAAAAPTAAPPAAPASSVATPKDASAPVSGRLSNNAQYGKDQSGYFIIENGMRRPATPDEMYEIMNAPGPLVRAFTEPPPRQNESSAGKPGAIGCATPCFAAPPTKKRVKHARSQRPERILRAEQGLLRRGRHP